MKIICITPVKNEEWMLDNFLKATSLWADKIIIADQGSTDNSVEIVKKYKKAILVQNPQNTFDEIQFRSLLLSEARKIPGQNIIFAIDADEVLTPNFESSDWNMLKKAQPGTWFTFSWLNLKPKFISYWPSPYTLPFAFFDNGANFNGTKIHGPRLPEPHNNTVINLNDIKILHLQYVNWERMQSKHRWYMCYETVENHKPWWRIYLEYHHMYAVNKNKIKPVSHEWIDGYKKKGIDIPAFKKEKEYWWDREVLKYFEKYGVEKFKMLDIWDREWTGYNNSQSWFIKLTFRVLKIIYPPIYRFYISLPIIKKNILKMFNI